VTIGEYIVETMRLLGINHGINAMVLDANKGTLSVTLVSESTEPWYLRTETYLLGADMPDVWDSAASELTVDTTEEGE
jgi:hypothetical protein